MIIDRERVMSEGRHNMNTLLIEYWDRINDEEEEKEGGGEEEEEDN